MLQKLEKKYFMEFLEGIKKDHKFVTMECLNWSFWNFKTPQKRK